MAEEQQTSEQKPGAAGHAEAVRRYGAEAVARGTQALTEGVRAGQRDELDALRRAARA
jgi:hypothetical protein